MTDYAEFEVERGALLFGGYVEVDSSLAEQREPTLVDQETFKAAMRVLATGVVMVTARMDERIWGLTISACCSISVSPPRVLISLAHDASCLGAILETRRFGLSILRERQRELAELGAVPAGRKYVDAFCESGPPGEESMMIAGALAHVSCSVHETHEVGDHTLLIGDVEAITVGRADSGDGSGPLVYFDRTFHSLGGEVA
jgi:flavin reductase ActVB